MRWNVTRQNSCSPPTGNRKHHTTITPYRERTSRPDTARTLARKSQGRSAHREDNHKLSGLTPRSRVSQKPNTNLTEQQPNLQSLWSLPSLPLDDLALKLQRFPLRFRRRLVYSSVSFDPPLPLILVTLRPQKVRCTFIHWMKNSVEVHVHPKTVSIHRQFHPKKDSSQNIFMQKPLHPKFDPSHPRTPIHFILFPQISLGGSSRESWTAHLVSPGSFCVCLGQALQASTNPR